MKAKKGEKENQEKKKGKQENKLFLVFPCQKDSFFFFLFFFFWVGVFLNIVYLWISSQMISFLDFLSSKF